MQLISVYLELRMTPLGLQEFSGMHASMPQGSTSGRTVFKRRRTDGFVSNWAVALVAAPVAANAILTTNNAVDGSLVGAH